MWSEVVITGSYAEGVREWGGGRRTNYFKIMQFFIRRSVYTPNSDPNLVIFLKIHTPPVWNTWHSHPRFQKVCICAWISILDTAFCTIFDFLFFWWGCGHGGGVTASSSLFHTFWAESIVKWGENGRSPRKPPDHLQAELSLSHM